MTQVDTNVVRPRGSQQPTGVVGFRPAEQLEQQFHLEEYVKGPEVEATTTTA